MRLFQNFFNSEAPGKKDVEAPSNEAVEAPKPAKQEEKSAKELGYEDLDLVVENAKKLFDSIKNALGNLGRRAWKGGLDILATTLGTVEKGGKKMAEIIKATPGFIEKKGQELWEIGAQDVAETKEDFQKMKDGMIDAGYSAAAVALMTGVEVGDAAYLAAQEIKRQGLDWKNQKVKEAVDGIVALKEKGINVGDVLRIVGVMKMKEASDAATQLKDAGIEVTKSGSAAVINAGIELVAHGINLKEAITEKGRNFWNKTTDIMGKAWDGSKELYLEARGAKNRFFDRVGKARKDFNEGASQLWDKFVGTAELKGQIVELQADKAHDQVQIAELKAERNRDHATLVSNSAAIEKLQNGMNEMEKKYAESLSALSRANAAVREKQPDEIIDITEGLEEESMEKGA